jgi:long-chain acyl-CoA synthetase
MRNAASSHPEVLRPLLRAFLRRPLGTVIVDDQRRWRGLQLYAATILLADRLQHETTRPRVGIMLPTSGMFPVALAATWMTGGTAVPLNYLLGREELEYVIGDAELDLVITVQPMLDRVGALPAGVRPLLLETLNTRRLPRPRRTPRESPDQTAVLIYTSGTSGRPKGVELTVGNLAANVAQCAEWGRVTTRDVFLGVVPQFHCLGLTVLTLLPLSAGGRVIYTARFIPRQFLGLMRKHRPTGMVGVPSMYAAIASVHEAGPADFASFRYVISGGEPLPDAVAERFRSRFGIALSQGYGLTETGPVLNWSRPEDGGERSVGRAVPGVEEIVADVAGRPLPGGQVGEVRVRGPNIMKGYFKRPELTATVFDQNGYFKTGDLGCFDEAGNLYITGRLSDLIIVAGENVYPAEVENVLERHPSIAAAAVIGHPDPVRGEAPVAFVELNPGSPFDEDAIRAFCRQSLATYKVPRAVRVVDELPRSPTGKVLRRKLQTLIAEEAPV